MKGLTLLFVCAFCAISINAGTTHIPADQPTIQAGFSAFVKTIRSWHEGIDSQVVHRVT